MAEKIRDENPTIKELRDKYDEIFNDQFRHLDEIQEQLDAINDELRTIRLILPSMRSPRTRNQLGKRQRELIETGSKLNETRTIMFMGILQPMAAMAKLLEFDSKPSEFDTPTTSSPQTKLSDDDLKALYQKYED